MIGVGIEVIFGKWPISTVFPSGDGGKGFSTDFWPISLENDVLLR